MNKLMLLSAAFIGLVPMLSNASGNPFFCPKGDPLVCAIVAAAHNADSSYSPNMLNCSKIDEKFGYRYHFESSPLTWAFNDHRGRTHDVEECQTRPNHVGRSNVYIVRDNGRTLARPIEQDAYMRLAD